MSLFQLDLPIKPFLASGMTHSVIRVTMDYNPTVKGPMVNLQTGESEDSAGFAVFRCIIFGSPSARVNIERGWKMKNQKRMAAAVDQVKAELAGKRGDTYEAIVKLLADNGSELLVPVSA